MMQDDVKGNLLYHVGNNGIKVIDIIEGFDLDFYEGSALKHILIAKHNGDGTQDLKEAERYLKIKRCNKEKKTKPYSFTYNNNLPSAPSLRKRHQ